MHSHTQVRHDGKKKTTHTHSHTSPPRRKINTHTPTILTTYTENWKYKATQTSLGKWMQAESPSKPRQAAWNERAAESKKSAGRWVWKKLEANKQKNFTFIDVWKSRTSVSEMTKRRSGATPASHLAVNANDELAPHSPLHVQQCSSLAQAELC